MSLRELTNGPIDHVYARVLTGLLLLFCFRVAAQLIQAWSPVNFLPPFDAWASGAIPYWLLCVFQGLIIIVCVNVIRRLCVRAVVPSAKMGRALLLIGGMYLGLMGLRLIVGLTILPDHFWFGAKLPTLFHLVLASFILVYGRFHVAEARETRSDGMTGAV